jgi:hypothetical protein
MVDNSLEGTSASPNQLDLARKECLMRRPASRKIPAPGIKDVSACTSAGCHWILV